MPIEQVPEEGRCLYTRRRDAIHHYCPSASLRRLRTFYRVTFNHGKESCCSCFTVCRRVTVCTWTPVGLKKSGLICIMSPICWIIYEILCSLGISVGYTLLFVQKEHKWNSLINFQVVKIVGLYRIKPKSSHPSTLLCHFITHQKNEHCKGFI